MIVQAPVIGLIQVVRLTRHFGVNRPQFGDGWHVTHIPSGWATFKNIPLHDAVRLADALETCGVDWDFYDHPGREHLRLALELRDRELLEAK